MKAVTNSCTRLLVFDRVLDKTGTYIQTTALSDGLDRVVQQRTTAMTTILIIVLLVLLLGGGGYYGRGRYW
jgi:hypothetical protein